MKQTNKQTNKKLTRKINIVLYQGKVRKNLLNFKVKFRGAFRKKTFWSVI